MENKKTSIFDEFTGKYELSKTLRFELKPNEKTVQLLKDNKVFEKDQTIDNSYNQAKFYFDEMHREFINNSLTDLSVNIIDSLKTAFLKKEEQDKNGDKKESNKEWEKARKVFCAKITDIFDRKARELEMQNGISKENTAGIKLLLSAKIINHLKQKYPKEKNDQFIKEGKPSLFTVNLATGEKQYIFDSFDKFSTYLGKFQETKNNLYTSDDKATSVASRIIDNFVIFWTNKNKFENKLKHISMKAGFSSDEQEMFKWDYYVSCLVQAGISKYNQSVGSLNKKIKEFRDKNQKEAKDNKQEFKKGDYPLLVELDKQILSYVDKEKELISDNSDLEKVFKVFVTENTKKIKKGRIFMNDFCKGRFFEEYERIYLQKKVLNTLSRKWFTDSNAFELLLPQTAGNKDKNAANIRKYISLADIKKALEKEESDNGLSGDIYKDKYYDDKGGAGLKRGVAATERLGQFFDIWFFEFENLFKNKKLIGGNLLRGYDFYLEDTKKINWNNLSKKFKKENPDRYKKEVERIKQYADAALVVYQMLKYFVLNAKDAPLGSDLFYGEFNDYYQDFAFIRYYDALRNFITKKSFNPEKIKLNFDKGNFLNGWQESPRGNAQFCGYILRKDGIYYLGISKDTHFLDIDKFNLLPENNEDYYEKLEFKSINWGKMIVGGRVYKSFTGCSYQEHKNTLCDSDHVDIVKKLIDEKYVKSKKFPELKSLLSKKFKNVKEMQKEFDLMEIGGMEFVRIKASRVNQQIIDNKTEKCLFLFRIQNKDFNGFKKTGKKNIHSLYWEQVFSRENAVNSVFSILGNAEVFLRRGSEDLPSRIINGREVIAHRRYSVDKLFLHIPIKINSGRKDKYAFNKQVNKKLSQSKEINIIGIDRGEKHLLYYSVVNQAGEILDQASLNEINGVNYFEKLNQREKERKADRKSWNQIEQIKDLKRGYLSGVVHKICSLIIKYEAIVVLEDLNMRFKQVRGGIEKSVYQQFEKTLIDKLGYMVFKDRDPIEAGGVLKGYQLAAPFESFEKMFKQTGILFYTQADYTSITDPVTGFRKNVYIGNSWSFKKISEAIGKFKSIKWDNSIGAYAFTYDTGDFNYDFSSRNKKSKQKKHEIVSKKWTVYSSVPRVERFRNEAGYWESNLINVTQEFSELFKIWDFSDPKGDILSQIKEKESTGLLAGSRLIAKKERDFYHRFVYLFNLVMQLRNSSSKKTIKNEDGTITEVGDDVDFIASPVYPFFSTGAKIKGVLIPMNLAGFDSKIKSAENEKLVSSLSGDSNGAYNIARKGVIIFQKIKDNSEKPELFISKSEWDKFAQGQYKLGK